MGLVIAVATIAGYGAVAWILGIRAAGAGAPLTYAVAPLAFVLLVGAAWRRKPADKPERRRERAQRGRIIGDVNGVLVVLIVLAVYLLRLVGRSDLLAPTVAVVGGLHFLAFARLFPARAYYYTSALLVGLGTAGFFLDPGHLRVPIVSIGASGILWLTCVSVLIWPESRRTGD